MTNIPSVEERVDEFADYQEKTDWCMSPHAAEAMVTADRTALLTELRNSELLEEKIVMQDANGSSFDLNNLAHNNLTKAIKAHINNLINPTNV